MATQIKVEPSLNGSGVDPLDHRVIILPDKAPEKVGSLFLPPSERDKQKYAMQTATVVAVGSMAWAEARHDAERFGMSFRAPEPGDRVRVGKYAGDSFDGADGQTYTLLNDEDVIGFLV